MSPRRVYRQPTRYEPLDPHTFVRRLTTKLGTPYALALYRRVVDLLRDGVDPGPWLLAIRRGRDTGTLPEPVARYLCLNLAEHAFDAIVYQDPILVDLMNRMEAIKRAHGLAEDEDWRVWEARSSGRTRMLYGNIDDLRGT